MHLNYVYVHEMYRTKKMYGTKTATEITLIINSVSFSLTEELSAVWAEPLPSSWWGTELKAIKMKPNVKT